MVITTAAAAAHVLVLVLSRIWEAPDLFVTYLLMLFVATNNWLYLLGAGCGSAAAVFAYQMFSHVRTRVEAWLDPWSDIAGKGYQISQSLFAIGTGGWFGMALPGNAFQNSSGGKGFYLSAISEELGGIYASA